VTKRNAIPAFANRCPVSGPRKENVLGEKYEVNTIAKLTTVAMM